MVKEKINNKNMNKEKFLKHLANHFGEEIECQEDIPEWGWKKGMKTKIDATFMWDCDNYGKGITIREPNCEKCGKQLIYWTQGNLSKDFWEYWYKPTCPSCNGKGKINLTPKDFIGDYGTQTCHLCGGSGVFNPTL